MGMTSFEDNVRGIDLREITERNLEVWRLIQKDKSPREIAALLHISVSGVKKHIERVMNITGTHTQTAALAVLMARKLL